MCSLRLTGVKLGCLAYPPDGVGGVAPIETLEIDGLGPELPTDSLALPAPVKAPADGLLEGDDKADGHGGRLGRLALEASRGSSV
jgi:hypothetical protein